MNSPIIEVMKSKGYTYLGNVENKEIFCNINNIDSVEKCLHYLRYLTGEGWDDYVENGGDRNRVFCRKICFM